MVTREFMANKAEAVVLEDSHAIPTESWQAAECLDSPAWSEVGLLVIYYLVKAYLIKSFF